MMYPTTPLAKYRWDVARAKMHVSSAFVGMGLFAPYKGSEARTVAALAPCSWGARMMLEDERNAKRMRAWRNRMKEAA